MPRRLAAFAVALLALLAPVASTADPSAPTADAVKPALVAFAAERAAAAKDFPAADLVAADRLAEQAKQALAEDNPAAADRLARDARWAVPLRPPGLPPHVGRVFGSGRLRHADRVNAVAYSPDGKHLASASRDGTVRVWDLGNGREVAAYRGHAGKAAGDEDANVFRAAGVAFSPDGRRVASVGGNEAHVWDAATGKQEKVLSGHTGQVRGVAWASDSALVTGSDDKTVIVWDVATGKATYTSPAQAQRVEAVAVADGWKRVATINAAGELTVYAPDTEKKVLLAVPVTDGGQAGYGVAFAGAAGLATCGGDNKAKLTAPPANDGAGGGATVRTYAGHTDKINALAADAKLLVTGSRDRTVRVWDVGTGKTLWSFQGHLGGVTAVALRPDGKEVASGGEDGSVKLWPLTTADDHRAIADAADPLWTVAVSPDGAKFAAAGADKKIRVYDALTGKLTKTLPGHTGAVTAVAFLDPDRLASVGGDKLVKVWDLTAGTAEDGKGHESAVLAVAADPAAKLLVTGSVDKSVRGWDAATVKPLWAWAGKSAVCAVAVAKDGKRVAVGTADGGLTVLSVNGSEPKPVGAASAHLAGTAAVAWSPDGGRLATCGGDGAVRVWSVPADGNPAPQLKLEPASKDPEGAPVVALAFSADGRFLATGGKDTLVRVWDVRTGAEVRALRGHTDWVTATAFRPDGQAIVSVGVDKAARVWDLARRDAAGPPAHALPVRCIAISKDGKRIATGSEDRTIKVWDADTGKEIATLAGPTDAVNAVAFDAAGKVYAASADNSVRTWAGPAWADEVLGKVGPGFGLVVTPDGSRVAVVWAKREDKLAVFEVLRKGAELASVTEKGRALSCAVIAPDGTLGVTGGEDGVARLWDLDKKDREGGDWPLFPGAIADLGLTADKKTLVAIDYDGTVKVADVAGREVTKSFAAVPDGVNGLIVAPTGGRFATLSAGGTVKLWDLAGKELRAWPLPVPATAAAFTADGKRLVTGNKDGTAYVLELP